MPEFVDPRRRPALARELDWLLPQLLDRLEEHGRLATFFVLGEVAAERPGRIREIAARGHEIASHGYLHQRRGAMSAAEQRGDAARSKALLEDLTGERVLGFRAPEWSLRRRDNPALRGLAELGYVYDSSLSPAPGVGWRGNPRRPELLFGAAGGDPGVSLLEVPPLAWGPRGLLPFGGWLLRCAPARWIERRLEREARAGGCPLLTVHPWELVARPLPGDLAGFARFVADAGRRRFAGALFGRLLGAFPWTSIRRAIPALGRSIPADRVLPSRLS